MKINSATTMLYSIIILTSTLLLTSCALNYKGSTVSLGSRIILNNNEQDQNKTWQSDDISMNYSYHLKSNQLTLSGTAKFTNHIIYNFDILDEFQLSVLLLDSNGKILEMKGLYSASNQQKPDGFSFNRTITMSENTKEIAFTYTGSVQEEGNQGNISTQFWKLPIK